MKAFGIFRHLYVQVLFGILIGIAYGAYLNGQGAPANVSALDVLDHVAKMFIDLIRMLIAPVIFCTVVAGVGHMTDMKKVGSIGIKTLVYFEVISTLALIIGLIVGVVFHPGLGMGVDPASVDTKDVAKYLKDGAELAKLSETQQLLQIVWSIVPKTFVGAFAEGNLLQVLLISILTGFACARLGDFGSAAAHFVEKASKVLFSIIHIVVKAAPVGAFAAMAVTIGKYGLGALGNLGALIACFYVTALLFVILVLGAMARLAGFSIFRFLRYIREELLLVLGTSSSESALPSMMEKLQRLGASKSVVGLVIPTGYSFNLDGTNIYMTLAMLFLAQATGTELSWVDMATLVGIAMITSKGASGVTGAGFITLAATLTVVDTIPAAAIAVIFGIDKFMSECRGLTNLVGNGVAALVVARWENELDVNQLHRELLTGPAVVDADREREDVLEVEEPAN